jgi:phage shock protein E
MVRYSFSQKIGEIKNLSCDSNDDDCSGSARKGQRVAGNTIKEKIAAGAKIIDVRSPAEFKDGAYPGAINIPLPLLPTRMAELGPKDTPIILYCASGARSSQGMRFLKQNGFTDVINAGGLDDMPE